MKKLLKLSFMIGVMGCLTACGGINIYINTDKEQQESQTTTEQEETEEVSKEKSEQTTEENNNLQAEAKEDDIEIKVIKEAEWGDEKEHFAKINITIENKSEKVIKDWKFNCDVGKEFSFKEKWNGEYELKDGKMTVTPVEYNKEIKPKEKIDFGFNARSTKEIEINEFDFTAEDINIKSK